jgi:hypothetical protein
MKWFFEKGLDSNLTQGEQAFSQELNRQRGDLKKQTSIFVRETISNCADQGVEDNLNPIDAYIDVINLSGSAKRDFLEEIDWENLSGHIKASITKQNTDASHAELYSGVRKMNDPRESIKLVRVSDYNTNGLVGGEDDENKNFHLFAKADFCTSDDVQRQGSFGLGKGVIYHRSLINAAIMSSTINEDNSLKTRVFGRINIPSHRYKQQDAIDDNPNGKWFGPGFFGNRSQKPNTFKADSVFNSSQSSQNKLFLKRDDERTGTTVVCVAFESDQDSNLVEFLTDDVRKWFWPAISQDNPKINITVREFNNHELVGSPNPIRINETYQPFSDCLNLDKNSRSLNDEGDIVSKEIQFKVPKKRNAEDQFVASLEIKSLKTNKDHSKINHIAYLRDNLTVVQYCKIDSNSVSKFVSVCKAGKSRGNSQSDMKFHDFLRLAEPALHNDWKYPRKIESLFEKGDKKASVILKDLDALILKTAKDFVNTEPEISDDNLNMLSQKFNFGKGGGNPKEKQLDYNLINKGTNNNKVYVNILIKNLRLDPSDWKSKVDFKIVGINGNENNLVIDELVFESIDNTLIDFNINKRNAYITASRAIERFKVQINATIPDLFIKEIQELDYELNVTSYAGER